CAQVRSSSMANRPRPRWVGVDLDRPDRTVYGRPDVFYIVWNISSREGARNSARTDGACRSERSEESATRRYCTAGSRILRSAQIDKLRRDRAREGEALAVAAGRLSALVRLGRWIQRRERDDDRAR